jgi:hypothetical protein
MPIHGFILGYRGNFASAYKFSYQVLPLSHTNTRARRPTTQAYPRIYSPRETHCDSAAACDETKVRAKDTYDDILAFVMPTSIRSAVKYMH